MSEPKISDAEILEADRLGLTYAQIADRFGTDERSVHRARQRTGLTKRVPDLTDAQKERIRVLQAEGMPSTWIAEDLGIKASRVRGLFPTGIDPEWQSVWQSIRQNSILLELHFEFAPKRRSK